MKRDGWTQLAGKWRHDATGWTVNHCGHPTAIRPYYLVSPAGNMVLAENGYGYSLLAVALDAVELRTGHGPMRDLFDLLDAG